MSTYKCVIRLLQVNAWTIDYIPMDIEGLFLLPNLK